MFFKIIYAGVRYTSEANTPFLLAQVLHIAYHVMRSYRMYTDACEDWLRKPNADNKWDNIKMFSHCIIIIYDRNRV